MQVSNFILDRIEAIKMDFNCEINKHSFLPLSKRIWYIATKRQHQNSRMTLEY